MFAQIIRILLYLTLCLELLSCDRFCLGCQTCKEYQDVAGVYFKKFPGDADIDSVVMIVNNSVIGCGNYKYKVIGSKRHNIRFPINARIQLFLQGDLWKEFSLKMDKNTEVRIHTGIGCSASSGETFSYYVNLAKEQNTFIDSSLTDDYCWMLEKLGNSPSADDMRCTEYSVDGKQDICDMWFLQ